MTTVRFNMRTPDGTPIPSTWFRIEPGYQDSVVQGQPLSPPVEFITDGNGEATLQLTAGKRPYYLSKMHVGADEPTAYKLFVPESNRVLDATVLYTDLSTSLRLKTDASLLALIDAKVAAVNAAHQVSMISSVLMPGSELISDLVDKIEAFETLVDAASDKAVAATLAAEAATLRANQAINAVTATNAASIAAGKLANEAHKHANEAFVVATEGKAAGLEAQAALMLLTARVTALGG